jgi:hypothetical protein
VLARAIDACLRRQRGDIAIRGAGPRRRAADLHDAADPRVFGLRRVGDLDVMHPPVHAVDDEMHAVAELVARETLLDHAADDRAVLDPLAVDGVIRSAARDAALGDRPVHFRLVEGKAHQEISAALTDPSIAE